MTALWRDIAYAVRSLRRQPGFAVAVVIVLGLGLAANTTIFSVVDGVLLHPPVLRAWHSPDRVLVLHQSVRGLSSFFADHLPARASTWLALKQNSHSFEALGAWQESNSTIRLNGKSEGVTVAEADSGLFSLIGIQPREGRLFSASEARQANAPVALISDDLYRSRFPGGAKAMGTTLTVDGKPVSIIGVLPPGVAFPASGTDDKRPQLWRPLVLPAQAPKDDARFTVNVYARLKEGVNASTASAELNVIHSQLAHAGGLDQAVSASFTRLIDDSIDGDTKDAVLLLQFAVGFVLLIACANAGNMLLTRTMARTRDLAIRASLGASAMQLMRQILLEGAVLTLAAAAFAAVIRIAALKVLSSIAPSGYGALQDLHPSGAVLAFTVAATVLTALIFGLIPAFYSRRHALSQSLNATSRTSTSAPNRLRSSLAILEIALSLVLVIGAGLAIRSVSALLGRGVGFDINRLLVMRLSLPDPEYTAPERLTHFNSSLLESVRNVNGVQSAALTTGLSMKALSQSTFEIPGRAKDPKNLPVTNWSRVSDRYFETLGLRVTSGRTLTHEDAANPKSTAAVVNQAFAATYFPNEEPVGKLVTFGNENKVPVNWRIVGVVPNERQLGPDGDQGPELYMPASSLHDFLVVARTTGDPARLAGAFRQKVADIDRNIEVNEIEPETAALDEWLGPRRFYRTVLLAFAGMALLLAITGLYSVLAYGVTSRTREIGIRIAVGASPLRIRGYILKGGMRLCAAGVATGIAASLAVVRTMQSLIAGITPFDPLTFITVTLLVLLASLLASYLPALRAARVDPVQALRSE